MSVISEDILLNQYIPFNRPVPYGGWEIHPIRLRDWNKVDKLIGLLTVDKNTLGQIDIIQMSYLRFILSMLSMEDDMPSQFDTLLKLSLGLNDNEVIQVYINDTSEYLCVGVPQDEICGRVIFQEDTVRKITADDFNEIKRIILYQNLTDYTDRYVDPDVKKAADDYWRLKSKGAKNVSLEHKVICVQMKTGMSVEAIGDLTVRNFRQLFGTIIDESEYIANRFAEANGAKFKRPLEHWAYKEDKDKYADAFCDAEAFAKEVQSAN